MTGTIGLSFAFEIKATIAEARSVGQGRLGHRRVIPITGGTVSGPRLNGSVLAGGADYELIRPDGNSLVEAHYALEADDGTVIYIVNKGLFFADPDVIEALDQGADVDPSQYYFRASPVFDAPIGPHLWLCDRIFVADCRFTPNEVSIRVFEVT